MTKSHFRELREHFRLLGVNRLLSDPTDNPKLAKSLKIHVMSAPLHLAPYTLSGYQVCPMATAGCAAACLHTAGNPAYMPAKERARVARTRAFFTDRPRFMRLLAYEIAALNVAAIAAGMRCGVRLNATSDIVWESVPVSWMGKIYPNLMAAFPDVSFYDYTKRHNRRNLPPNYHLTYSLAETDESERRAIAWLESGRNVAVVFDTKPRQPLPSLYGLGRDWYCVIDGDEHDYRPADPAGVIVGLRAKGRARSDTSGFVRSVA